jgi:transcriptional antiterminator RfaH
MSFWAAAQLDARHIRLALHCLQLSGFETYAPRLRQRRLSHGRKIERRPLLFVTYVFVAIVDHWWAAHRTPGVIRLVRDGDRPARVPEAVITELRRRERGGLIELSTSPRFKRGDPVKVTGGAFAGHLGLYDGQAPHERVAVLLALLGGRVRVELPEAGIEPVRANIEAAP